MRIIDNKYDFYDYLQDPTDQLVFDRRGSYNLTKEVLCSKITKDHILYCLDDCSPEIIDAAKRFFKQYGIEPLSVAI